MVKFQTPSALAYLNPDSGAKPLSFARKVSVLLGKQSLDLGTKELGYAPDEDNITAKKMEYVPFESRGFRDTGHAKGTVTVTATTVGGSLLGVTGRDAGAVSNTPSGVTCSVAAALREVREKRRFDDDVDAFDAFRDEVTLRLTGTTRAWMECGGVAESAAMDMTAGRTAAEGCETAGRDGHRAAECDASPGNRVDVCE
jgi:hypothetical protein